MLNVSRLSFYFWFWLGIYPVHSKTELIYRELSGLASRLTAETSNTYLPRTLHWHRKCLFWPSLQYCSSANWGIKFLKELSFFLFDIMFGMMWFCKLYAHQVIVCTRNLNPRCYSLWNANLDRNYPNQNGQTQTQALLAFYYRTDLIPWWFF